MEATPSNLHLHPHASHFCRRQPVIDHHRQLGDLQPSEPEPIEILDARTCPHVGCQIDVIYLQSVTDFSSHPRSDGLVLVVENRAWSVHHSFHKPSVQDVASTARRLRVLVRPNLFGLIEHILRISHWRTRLIHVAHVKMFRGICCDLCE